jgi:carboxypeptidase Taq
MAHPAYLQLVRRFDRISAIKRAAAILDWDRQTVMPRGACDDRSEQLATLAILAHDAITAAEVGDLLADAEAATSADPWWVGNLREMRRSWTQAHAVPSDLIAARIQANARCEMLWRDAKPRGDFRAVLPALTEVVTLTRRVAEVRSAVLGVSLYDALIDEYEPGGRSAAIDALFAELRQVLPDLMHRAIEHQRRGRGVEPLIGKFPIAAQRALAERLLAVVGFDFDRGRLDVSAHPFSGGTSDDNRITTRYDETDFTRALMAVLHEAGHAMYSAGLPRDHWRQPVGAARGMVIDESQALLIEMQVCRSGEFLQFAAPLMRAAFDGAGAAWDVDNLHRMYTRVAPGCIRSDADEITYPLHIMLRYRLERAIISGDLGLADVPGAWNDGMRDDLGIVPPSHTVGCLQDIHWYDGAWGYFPCYTLGALAAAQLYAAARVTLPTLAVDVSRGDFGSLIAWLQHHVHGRGSSTDTESIVRDATGSELGTAAFRAHLERRYLE